MKLTGGRNGGRHLAKNGSVRLSGTAKKTAKKKNKGAKIVLRFIAAVFLIMVTGAIAVFAYYKLAVKPPTVSDSKRPSTANTDRPGNDKDSAEQTPSESEPSEDTPKTGRQPLKYTFLIMGTDDGNGNTDTIMIVTFDAANSTLDVVNIPRDTMVNVAWPTKRVNSLLANVKIDGTVEKLADVLGFEVDYYAIINLKAFSALVDAVDGIDYNIPVKMYYNDPAQNLLIDFPKGMRHLNGADALKVVRYRSYGTGDIGRIDTQQDFLASAAKQILAKRSSLKITEICEIFFKYVKGTNTNLEMNHMIYFAQELLKLDAENIRFTKMPGNYNDHVSGQSYVSIYVDEWLELINERLNPFYEEITKDDLSIITRGSDGKIYATDGKFAYSNTSWGGKNSSSGSSSSGQSSSGSSSGQSSNSSPGSGSSSGGSSGTQQSSSGGSSETSGGSETDAPVESIPPDTAVETPDDTTPADETPSDGEVSQEPPVEGETGTEPDYKTETPYEEEIPESLDEHDEHGEYPSQIGPPPEMTDVPPGSEVVVE